MSVGEELVGAVHPPGRPRRRSRLSWCEGPGATERPVWLELHGVEGRRESVGVGGRGWGLDMVLGFPTLPWVHRSVPRQSALSFL